ncbi:MAG: BtaA family protein [Oligoflexia bacterium]|nr:BtaA family protein [Oligoflexia bacterium]
MPSAFDWRLMAYFEKLNYTLSNEDTRVEYALLPPGAKRVFAIAGSGARVLPLIARNPEELEIVDLSRAQLDLCELRVAAARALSYPEFLFFLGYRGGIAAPAEVETDVSDDRMALFQRLELSPSCREFWLSCAAQWQPRGFILLGKWESHFQALGKLFRQGFRMNFRPIFEAQSLEEQQALYRKHWKPTLFRNFLRMAASELVFNKFLYHGHFSGASAVKTESRPPWKFLDDEFRRLFTTKLVRKNYFLQVLFLGGIHFEEGLPLEARPEIVEAVRASRTRLVTTQGNLLEVLPTKPFDFLSLSDTISYLPEDAATELLQKLHPATPAGSRAVIRSFLRAPTQLRQDGWELDTQECRKAFERDGTGVYRFFIYRKTAG